MDRAEPPLPDETDLNAVHPEDPSAKTLFGLLLDAQEALEDGDADAGDKAALAQSTLRRAPAEVVEQARGLMGAHQRADTGLFCEPKMDGLTSEHPTGDGLGTVVEPPVLAGYEIGDEIGRGGFGVVYRGMQLVPVRRPVAVKVLRADLATPAMVARFRSEASTLARMNHEGIARVIDAGQDQLNRPFVVMELIEGRTLIEYCSACGLSVRQRVALFVSICDAVQHAHQRAVIHRDLKPANILVEDRGGRAQARVIDFGIAKLLEDGYLGEGEGCEGLSDAHTLNGQKLGTPRYMSPEQREGDGQADTRIDVFSLGVLLCEALTGSVPYDQKGTGKGTGKGAQSATRPSVLVSEKSTTQGAGKISAATVSELRGDLDRIVLKAVALDPDLRYQSAEALEADLVRYLEGRPVLAKEAGVWYRTVKFVGRHRLASAFGMIALLGLIVGGIGLGVGLDRAMRSRDTARQALIESERQRNRAEFVNTFLLEDMLGSIDPNINQGRDITVREVFDRASDQLAARTDLDLETQYATLRLIGLNYRQIGANSEAIDALTQAAELADRVHGVPNERSIRIRLDLYDTIVSNGRGGRAAVAEVLDRDAQALLSADDVLYQRVRMRTSQSIEELAGIVDGLEADLETNPESRRVDLLVALANLGHLYAFASMPAERLETRRKSYELSLAMYGPDHSTTLSALAAYAAMRAAIQRDKQTLVLLKDAYEPARRLMGLEHPITLRNMRSYAFMLARLGEHEQAIALLEENVEAYGRLTGETSIQTTLSLSYLGRVQLMAGHAEAALPLLIRVQELQAKQWSAGHKNNVYAPMQVAKVHLAMGDGASARDLAERTLGIVEGGSLAAVELHRILADAFKLEGEHGQAVEHAWSSFELLGATEPETLEFFDVGRALLASLDGLGKAAMRDELSGMLERTRKEWDRSNTP
tara:strand:+ start:38398 stop:41196 length:2799 start_codon:yes stop_codon:yes gene_type:complete